MRDVDSRSNRREQKDYCGSVKWMKPACAKAMLSGKTHIRTQHSILRIIVASFPGLDHAEDAFPGRASLEGVLLETLKHTNVESVMVIGRRSCKKMHAQLDDLIHQDFSNDSSIEEHLRGYNSVLLCLGGYERTGVLPDHVRTHHTSGFNPDTT
jgi:hypothetical protein